MQQVFTYLRGAILASLFIISSFLFSSCSHQIKTGMGGFADISLNRNSSEYEIKRLPEISGSLIRVVMLLKTKQDLYFDSTVSNWGAFHVFSPF
jgi:hypothetical protein